MGNPLRGLLRPRGIGNPTQKADGCTTDSHDPPDGMGSLREIEPVRLTDADDGAGYRYT
jgi:hypothetical protein